MSKCIDAGGEGCPCILAESGNCLVCSKLNGENCDVCSWQGSCIYTLYEQNGRRPAKERQARIMTIVEKKTYGPDFSVFVLEADYGFCQKASAAGSYVFLSRAKDNLWYSAPISILKSEPEKRRIHLGVSGCGPKSKSILEEEGGLSVRGIFRNGLSGMSSLLPYPDRALVFGKGIAMAPLRNFLDGGERYAAYLNNMHFLVDLDKVGMEFFRDYFGDLPVQSVEICDFAQIKSFEKGEKGRENVFALASPYYVKRLQRETAAGSGFVYPAEGNFCCGEGICGACTCSDPKGNTIRRCKMAE